MAVRRDDRYYTVAEAAAELGVSPSTVWRWIDANVLPAQRLGRRRIRIRREDLALVVSPARPTSGDPGIRPDSAPLTPDALERRRALGARLLELRDRLAIAPLTTEELLTEGDAAHRGTRMFEQAPTIVRSDEADSDDTLVAAIWIDGDEERVRYFTDESEARAFLAERLPADPLSAIGAWSDLDWEEVERELYRIRHESTPTPPIDDLDL